MSEWLLWLVTVELLGLAALPLASLLFGAFPDRGYGLSKPLGILLLAFANWWLGSLLKLGNYPPLLWVLAVLLAVGGVLLYRGGLIALPADRRTLAWTIAIEEALFLVAFIFWTYVRAQNADIYETEKPMDFMLMQVSGMTHSFPPPDAWLSGHTVNYYYLGYAIFAMIGNLAGVDSRFGFNLANITIFAMGCLAGYSIGLALTRSRLWAFAGTFLVMLAGDLDALGQLITQIQNGTLSGGGLNLFCSTRIIDSTDCGNYRTITEFPIFSVLWNDLHPHLMTLPFALLAIGMACAALLAPGDEMASEVSASKEPASPESAQEEEVPDSGSDRIGWYLQLACLAIVLGALYPSNSWDYPPYLVLALAALYAGTYRQGRLTGQRAWEIALVVPASLLLYLPYYLTVHLAGQGRGLLGWHPTASDLGQVLVVIGILLVPMFIFVVWRTVICLIEQNASDEGRRRAPLRWLEGLPPGAGWPALCGLVVGLVVLQARTDTVLDVLLALGILCAAYVVLTRLRTTPSATLMALGLALLGMTLLLLVEFFYLRDNFDDSPSYRMNTMFKLYYQAWLLLSVGAAYAVAAMTRALYGALRRVKAEAAVADLAQPSLLLDPRGRLALLRGAFGVWIGGLVLAAAAAAVYPIWGVGSLPPRMASTPGLDGLAYLQLQDTSDYEAVTWIRQHLPSDAVIAEADGVDTTRQGCGEYWVCGPLVSYNRISALTGRPTVIGWPGSHEALWRGVDGTVELSEREQDVRTLYTTTSVARARQIIDKYHIQYVYVGPLEQATYVSGLNLPQSVLDKFRTFLTPRQTFSGAILYAVK